MREGGIEGGQRDYDAFATSLANRYSAQMDAPTYCGTVDEFVRLASRASSEELMDLAEAVAEAPDSGTCPPSNYRFPASDTEMGQPDYARGHEPPPPPRIAIVERAPAPEASGVAAAPAALSALAPTADKDALIAQAVEAAAPASAPAPQPAAAAQPKQDEALKAAIVALQSAITVLQAATATQAAPVPQPALVKVPDAPVVPPEATEQN